MVAVGDMVDTMGAGFVTGNVRLSEKRPSGLTTAIFSSPAVPISAAGIVAVNWELETTVVASGELLNVITDPGDCPRLPTVTMGGVGAPSGTWKF